jgi:hypothetical protein
MPISPRLDEIFTDLAGVLGASSGGLSDSELLADVAAVERVGRLVDAARVRLAGEVSARSRAELGDEGLSRSQNFTSPARLVSAVTGASVRECGKRLTLGARLRGAVQLGGGVGPEPYPAVSDALADGRLGVETASVIITQCAALGERGLPADAVAGAEQTLVDETLNGHLTADQTVKLAIRLRELPDPDGAEPRDDLHQQLRSLTFTQSGDGMLRGRFALTLEQSGIWLSSLQALQSPRNTEPRFVDEDEFVTQTVVADTRTVAQKNVDTVTELIARASGAADMPRLNGATTTVNVHVTLNDLEAGRGVGWVDGVDEPVPATTIEQLRCHSPIATTVFGDTGEVLHHGKTRRLFSPAQNRALAARDGGCVWPDCERPPSWCESHHVDEWVADDHPPGRTDIDNGLLLCHFHHSHLHKSAWKLVMQRGLPHIVPPRWIDVEQTPIPTTRRRTIQRPAA